MHQFDGIALQQAHARGDGRHFRIAPGTGQAIFEQGGDQRLALDQGHLAAQGGEDEGVAAQASCRVQYLRPDTGLHTDRLGDHLPAAAAKLAPMRGSALDEIHPHRAWRVGPELQQLQAVRAQLQDEVRLALTRQPQPHGPGLQHFGKGRLQGLGPHLYSFFTHGPTRLLGKPAHSARARLNGTCGTTPYPDGNGRGGPRCSRARG
ncbi:hypothetical protein D9M71_580070 [compost metagenome]